MKIRKDWTNRLKVGDVVKTPTGALRIVRKVTHSIVGDHIRTSVSFTIQRCSWTGRCYTTYTSSDLKTLGYRPTRAKATLRKKIDKKIDFELNGGEIIRMYNGWEIHRSVMPDQIKTHCCDVRGIA